MIAELKNGGVGAAEDLVVKRGEVMRVAPAEEVEKGLYFLSNLDQNIAVVIQTVYCYKPASGDGRSAVDVIKDALAKVLVHYYPLAGRLTVSAEGKLVIDSTGEGAVFLEADAADFDMADLNVDFSKPDPVMLGKLVYDAPGATNILEMPLLSVQVTRFRCGGFAVGCAMNHCVFDGIGAMQFIASWAETARGEPLSVPPVIDRSVLRSRNPPVISFPHHEFAEIPDVSGAAELYKEELLYRSFCFDPEKLQSLKIKASDDGGAVVNRKPYTSFEALTGLVWRARTAALRLHPDQKVKLLFAVDVRGRLSPPLPKGYFGNGIVLTCAVSTAGDLQSRPIGFAAGLVSDAIKIVTDEFVRSAVDYFEATRARPSLTATLLITTWSRLGFHQADFGWGSPVQAGPVTLPEKEVVLFLAHGEEKRSINVLLGLPSSAMVAFQELVDEL